MENTKNLVLEERKRLSVGGVAAVESFSPERIKLKTSLGNLTVSGENLKISAFSESSGWFVCDGKVDGLAYSKPKESPFKRMFK